MRREGRLLLALLAVAAVLPLVIHDDYILHLLVVAGFYVILASSLNLIVGYVGELSLGHAAYLGLGAYAAALATTRLGLSPALSLLAGAAAGGLGGLVIGALTLRLKGPYFVIVTLAFAEVLRLVAGNWVDLTNGPMGISGIAPPDVALGRGLVLAVHSQAAFFYLVLVLAALALLVMYRFVHSTMGRAAIAIRENRNVAQSVGIDPFFYALAAFVLGALFAGVAGAFYAHYFTYVGPEVFGFSFMMSMLIMVLVGGKGTLIGPVLGALLVTLADEYLREAQQLRLTLFGLLVIAVVLFLPEGLVGLPARLRRAAGARAEPRQ
jgi:branched-chain amino acid transport system permease protein